MARIETKDVVHRQGGEGNNGVPQVREDNEEAYDSSRLVLPHPHLSCHLIVEVGGARIETKDGVHRQRGEGNNGIPQVRKDNDEAYDSSRLVLPHPHLSCHLIVEEGGGRNRNKRWRP